jgi:iron complex transport system permease protein
MSGLIETPRPWPAKRWDKAWLRSSAAAPVVLLTLLVGLLAVALMSASIGAAGIPLDRIPAALGLWPSQADAPVLQRDQLVLWSVRLPRVALAVIVGALLAGSGAIMQGLYRNPLADPALVGVSSGGALAACASIVIGDRLLASSRTTLPFEVLPLAAFAGALAAAWILYRLATRESRTSIAILLLGGIAIAALANAGLGLLVFVANDQQLRDVTYWLLGSLGGATWTKVAILSPFLAGMLLLIPFLARGLDLLVLGEAEAFHTGIEVERLKRLTLILVAAMTGAAVSFSGIVAFVGIVVPHLLRLVIGPGHRTLLPASACLGAILLLAADTCARTVAAPAEVPIGILTALVGAPFFLMLLLRQRGLVGL